MIKAKQVFFFTFNLKGHGFYGDEATILYLTLKSYSCLCCLKNSIFLKSVQYIKRYGQFNVRRWKRWIRIFLTETPWKDTGKKTAKNIVLITFMVARNYVSMLQIFILREEHDRQWMSIIYKHCCWTFSIIHWQNYCYCSPCSPSLLSLKRGAWQTMNVYHLQTLLLNFFNHPLAKLLLLLPLLSLSSIS